MDQREVTRLEVTATATFAQMMGAVVLAVQLDQDGKAPKDVNVADFARQAWDAARIFVEHRPSALDEQEAPAPRASKGNPLTRPRRSEGAQPA